MPTDPEGLKLTFAVYRSYAEWATIAVFIGLLGDILVIFAFSKDKPKAETWLAFACTLLIALGVYGEYSFGGKAARAADQLQQISDKTVAELYRQAEHARQETARLEAIVAGRQLNDEQAEDLTNSLTPFASREIFITAYSGDAEAARLGLQIRFALGKAKLHVADELGRTVASGGGVAFGIIISGPPVEKDLIDALAGSLRMHAKLDARGSIGEPTMRIGKAVTGIMVALKPTSERK